MEGGLSEGKLPRASSLASLDPLDTLCTSIAGADSTEEAAEGPPTHIPSNAPSCSLSLSTWP